MHVEVMRTIASRGLRILGSGTFSTFTLYGLHQVTAFMMFAPSVGVVVVLSWRGCRALAIPSITGRGRARVTCSSSPSARRFHAGPARLSLRRGHLAGFHQAFKPSQVFSDLAGGVLAEQ